ncbi:MAG: hypothetical protein IJD81_00525 [Oscillospiraceae bacterium]|nr:hypothetical protein [Oscillospiraceae bacterium]
MNLEKLEALQQNEAVKKEIESAESIEALKEILVRNGIEATEAELAALVETPEGELSEDTLDNVAGGCWGGRIVVVFVPYPPFIVIKRIPCGRHR